MTRLTRHPRYAWGLASLFTFGVFAPISLGLPDSFPLSTYPMFAKPRGRPQMVKLVAVTDEESIVVEPHHLGTNEVLQAKVLLQQVADKPAAQRRKFCARTAQRISHLTETASWQELRLIRVQFDPIDYFYNGARPVSEKVLTHCPIRRESSPERGKGPL